jgi:hypothetical protein
MQFLNEWRDFVDEQQRSNALIPIHHPQQIAQIALENESEKDWFEQHDEIIDQIFGADADLFRGILAAMSQAENVPRNVKLALREYFRIIDAVGRYDKQKIATRPERDMRPFAGAAFGNVSRILKGLGPGGKKISAMFNVMMKQDDWIVDRHILRIIFGQDFGHSRWKRDKAVDAAIPVLNSVQNHLPGWSKAQIQSALRASSMKKGGAKEIPDYGGELTKNLDWMQDELEKRMEFWQDHAQDAPISDEEMGFTPMVEKNKKKVDK